MYFNIPTYIGKDLWVRMWGTMIIIICIISKCVQYLIIIHNNLARSSREFVEILLKTLSWVWFRDFHKHNSILIIFAYITKKKRKHENWYYCTHVVLLYLFYRIFFMHLLFLLITNLDISNIFSSYVIQEYITR